MCVCFFSGILHLRSMYRKARCAPFGICRNIAALKFGCRNCFDDKMLQLILEFELWLLEFACPRGELLCLCKRRIWDLSRRSPDVVHWDEDGFRISCFGFYPEPFLVQGWLRPPASPAFPMFKAARTLHKRVKSQKSRVSQFTQINKIRNCDI
jgi:hypothetical protein